MLLPTALHWGKLVCTQMLAVALDKPEAAEAREIQFSRGSQ